MIITASYSREALFAIIMASFAKETRRQDT